MTLWHAAAKPDRPKQIILEGIPTPPAERETDFELFHKWARQARDRIMVQRPWRVPGPVAIKIQLGFMWTGAQVGKREEYLRGLLERMNVIDKDAKTEVITTWTRGLDMGRARLTVSSASIV